MAGKKWYYIEDLDRGRIIWAGAVCEPCLRLHPERPTSRVTEVTPKQAADAGVVCHWCDAEPEVES